jgi:uncharacterized protein (TIGR04222 family)
MWPFDMRGPDFLVFYLIICAIVITAEALLRHSGESSDMPKVNLSDPYLIAFLRGGKNETLRVVTMALVDRGVLVADGTKITAAEGAWGKTQSELERKIIRHFTPTAEASSLFKTKETDPEMWQYEQQLTQLKLLPDVEIKQARSLRMWIALLIGLGLAITKIVVALNTGHSNIEFLCILAVIFAIVVVKVSRPRLTKAGEQMIGDLRTMFDGLKTRASQYQGGASPTEFALMAAVFGMAMVPDAKKLFPQAGSSSCGSSCGSSSGDGGGDGGGGDGGGCGGCGGG